MCLFFVGIVAYAMSWSGGTGLAPLAVGGSGLALSILQFIQDMRESRRNPIRVPIAAMILVAWLIGFVIATLAFGLLAGPFLSIAAFLRLNVRTSHGFAFSVALAYTVSVWLLFDVVLQLRLFPGLLLT
jgi:uncharacterized membrane protein YGL010W